MGFLNDILTIFTTLIVVMERQNNQQIPNTVEGGSESAAHFQCVKQQTKATQTSVTTEAMVRYSPLPPVKSKPPRAVTAGEKVTVIHQRRGTKLVSFTNSAPLPSNSSSAIASPSPQQSMSAPVQPPCTFQWPTVREGTGHKRNSVIPKAVQRSPEGRERKGREDLADPFPLTQTRRSGATKMSSVCRKSVKDQQDEVTRGVSLSKKWKRDFLRSPVSSQRETASLKMPNLQGSSGKEMKAVNYKEASLRETSKSTLPPMRHGKRNLCVTNSSPVPRRTYPKLPPLKSQPQSAPAKMVPAFPWTAHALPEENPVRDPSGVVKNKNVHPQKRRVRFLKTESGGSELAPHSETCSIENECDDVFESIAMVSPRASTMASCLTQKTADTNAQERHNSTDLNPTNRENNINVAKFVRDMVRNSSPDSFVSQLISASKRLTLYDSVESPSLKERKKKARSLSKKNG